MNEPSPVDVADPQTTVLADGRTLAFAEYGDLDGTPVLAFHGVLGSRHTWALCDEVARDKGVRLVAPDRPGFGHSDFHPDRAIIDWPGDVTTLADHLGIDRFGVVGFSGGGPHALACADRLPARTTRVALVSSVTPPTTHDRTDPFNRSVLSAIRTVPGFSRSAFETAAWLAEYARPQFRASIVGTAAKPDRDLFAEPVGDRLVADAAEAFRRGGRGPAHELPLLGGDWGFDAAAVETPVEMFHGTADETVTIDPARAFADLLPECDLHVTDDAHYSTYVRNREAILDAVA